MIVTSFAWDKFHFKIPALHEEVTLTLSASTWFYPIILYQRLVNLQVRIRKGPRLVPKERRGVLGERKTPPLSVRKAREAPFCAP